MAGVVESLMARRLVVRGVRPKVRREWDICLGVVRWGCYSRGEGGVRCDSSRCGGGVGYTHIIIHPQPAHNLTMHVPRAQPAQQIITRGSKHSRQHMCR